MHGLQVQKTGGWRDGLGRGKVFGKSLVPWYSLKCAKPIRWDDGCIEKGKMRDMTLLHSPQLIQAPLTSQEDPENLRKAPTPPLHFVALLYYVCINVSKLVCRDICEHYSNIFKVYTHNINRYVYILILDNYI